MVAVTCLSCKFYKVKNTTSGFCLVTVKKTGNREAERPAVEAQTSCDQWEDAGQQYYIRLGWIKSQTNQE